MWEIPDVCWVTEKVNAMNVVGCFISDCFFVCLDCVIEQVTNDHEPDVPAERESVEKKGGKVIKQSNNQTQKHKL
jgi:hypothetical protein